MVSEIVTRRWCDVCMAELGKRAEAESFNVAINAAAGNIDLCAEHVASAVTPLLEALARHGQVGKDAARDTVRPRSRRDSPLPAPRRRREPRVIPDEERIYVCLVCPLGDRTRYVSESGLRMHLQAHHGVPRGSFAGLFTSLRCPLCGVEMRTLRAFSYHLAPNHQVRHVTQAYDLAERQGDPHGVVATLARPSVTG